MGPICASGWEKEAGIPFLLPIIDILGLRNAPDAGELLGTPQMTKEAQCEGHRKGKVVGKTQGGNSNNLKSTIGNSKAL